MAKPSGTIVIARLNDRAQPVDRGELYEDPLQELLAGNAWGEVSGGGSLLSEQGEIQFCDIEILLVEVTPEILGAIATKLESHSYPLCERARVVQIA